LKPGVASYPLILEFPVDSAGYGREIFDRISKRELPGNGSSDDIAEQIVEYDRKVGGFEIASLRVNCDTLRWCGAGVGGPVGLQDDSPPGLMTPVARKCEEEDE